MREMNAGCLPDVTFERLHEIADAFARRDVDGIVNSFAADGEFRNARGAHHWGESYRGKAAVRSYFTPMFAGSGDVQWRHTSEFIHGNRAVTEWHAPPRSRPASRSRGWAATSTPSARA